MESFGSNKLLVAVNLICNLTNEELTALPSELQRFLTENNKTCFYPCDYEGSSQSWQN